MTKNNKLPLDGLRVLAFEQYGAGPFGTQFLADLGADVIKVETPGEGDMARNVGPYFLEAAGSTSASLFFQAFNRNKRSVTLDLTRPEAREVLQRMVRNADAVACNLRGDVPAKLGLTYEALAPANPRIVCAFLSAYGREGSRAAWPGYDYLMQAEAGYFALTGEADTPPSRMGLSIVDLMTGLGQAFALVSAVLRARETGIGGDIDISLFDLASFNLCYLAAWYLNTGHAQQRVPRSGHPSLTPCQLYRTGDGWIYLMCNKEKFWPILCELVGRAEWAKDARFRRFPDRFAHRELLTELLDQALSLRTTTEWMTAFGGHIPAAPVLDVADALENPFVAERGGIQELTDDHGETFRLLAQPVRAGQPRDARPAPELGADTDAILAELGYDQAAIRAFRDEQVI